MSTTETAQWPLISVVLPTRGRPLQLREALDGVLKQTYPGPLEVVVVHDQEPVDETLTWLSAAGRCVHVHQNHRAPGLAGARNAGREHVRGRLVASCDDDDVWHADKLRTQVEWLGQHPGCSVVGAGIRLIMPAGRIVEWPGKSTMVAQADLLRSRVKELHSSTLLIRRDTFDAVGGYDEELPFSYAEDYEWLLRAARLGPLGVVTAPLADIRKDGTSWFRERQEHVALALMHVHAAHPEFEGSRRGEARLLAQIAFALATSGQRRDAARWLFRATRRWPFTPHALLTALHVSTGLDPRTTLRAARAVGRGLT